MVSDVPDVPPTKVNGPDDDVELNTWYHVASGEALQDMVILVDDIALAVTCSGGDRKSQSLSYFALLQSVPTLLSRPFLSLSISLSVAYAAIGTSNAEPSSIEIINAAKPKDILPFPMLRDNSSLR